MQFLRERYETMGHTTRRLTLGMMFHGQGMTGFFSDTGGLSWIKI